MAWDIITGDAQLIPSSGSNEIILETGKTKKVRLLLQQGEEPYSFFQHTLENEKQGENGQMEKIFRTVNCPKTKTNPYAPCSLCDGQQSRRRIRHASKAYDYDTQSAKYLIGGEQIWKPIATLAKMGIDPASVDWGVLRSGKGRNDTEYSATNIGPAQYQPTPEIFDTISSPVEEYRPHTIEEMKGIVETVGLVWDKMIVPPPIQYQSSLQDALNHVIPNTKYKDQTMEQVWNTNKGMIEFFAKSDRVTPEKSAAQIILVALGGATIEGVPNYGVGNSATTSTPQGQATQATQQTVQEQATPSGDRQAKINKVNELLQTNKKFIDGGYQVIIDTMKEASGGKSIINDFTGAELDKMIEICQA